MHKTYYVADTLIIIVIINIIIVITYHYCYQTCIIYCKHGFQFSILNCETTFLYEQAMTLQRRLSQISLRVGRHAYYSVGSFFGIINLEKEFEKWQNSSLLRIKVSKLYFI